MDLVFNYLNQNIIFNGIIMFIMNIGGKYIAHEIPESFDIIFNKYTICRYLVIFSIAFIATRNIKISILLTLVFILFFRYLINSSKKTFIFGNKLKLEKTKKENVKNYNNLEYLNALDVIKKYHSFN